MDPRFTCPYVSKSKNGRGAPRHNPLTVAFVQSHHAVSYQSTLSEDIICPSASSCSSTHPNDHKEPPTNGRVSLPSFIHSWIANSNSGAVMIQIVTWKKMCSYFQPTYFYIESVHIFRFPQNDHWSAISKTDLLLRFLKALQEKNKNLASLKATRGAAA